MSEDEVKRFGRELRGPRRTSLLFWLALAIAVGVIGFGQLLGSSVFMLLLPAGVMMITSARRVARGYAGDLALPEGVSTLDYDRMAPADRTDAHHTASIQQYRMGAVLVLAGLAAVIFQIQNLLRDP